MSCWSGCLRSWLTARGEALNELAGDADDHLVGAEAGHLLGFLERHLAVVDDRARCRRPCPTACAPGPAACGRRHAPWPCRRGRSRRRAPWQTPCRCPAPCRPASRSPSALQEAAPESHSRRRRYPWSSNYRRAASARAPSRIAVSALGSRSRRVPRAWAISGRPPPGRRSPARRPDERAGGHAARHQVVADGHEQLRLVRLEAERDDAVAQLGAQRAERRTADPSSSRTRRE